MIFVQWSLHCISPLNQNQENILEINVLHTIYFEEVGNDFTQGWRVMKLFMCCDEKNNFPSADVNGRVLEILSLT